MNDPVFIDGQWATAEHCSAPEFDAPFPETTENFLLRQTWTQDRDAFIASPPALDTPHPDYPNFILVAISPQRDVGEAVVEFDLTFAKLPGTRSETAGTFSYNQIGFWPWSGYFGETAWQAGRPRRAKPINSRYEIEYFLVGPGQTYTTFEDIPVIEAQRYTQDSDPDADVDYLVDQTITPLIPATIPTLPAYKALVAAGTEIVAEDSTINRWFGNIFFRQTRKIVAP